MDTTLPTPVQLADYLPQAGWRLDREAQDGRIGIYSYDVDGEPIIVVVPKDQGFTDWRLRVRDAVRTVSDILDQPFEDVVAAIRQNTAAPTAAPPARVPAPITQAEIDATLQALAGQGPAAFQFHWRDARLTPKPPDAVPSDAALAAETLARVRQAAQELQQSLARSNQASPQRVVDTVDGLLTLLPDTLSALRPGLLLAQVRAVEADAHIYAKPINDLAPDHAARLLALAKSARDLLSCFAEIRAMEAERVAQEIGPDYAPTIQMGLTLTAELIGDAYEVVTPETVDAASTMVARTEAEVPPTERLLRIGELALVMRSILSPILFLGVFSLAAGRKPEALPAPTERSDDDASGAGMAMHRSEVVQAVQGLIRKLARPIAGLTAYLKGFKRLADAVGLLRRVDDADTGATFWPRTND